MDANSSFSQSVRNIKKLLQILQRRTKFQYFFELVGKEVRKDILAIYPKREFVDEYNKTFWLLIEHSYFKKIEKIDLNVLSLLKQTLMNQSSVIFGKETQLKYQHFQIMLRDVFTQQYLSGQILNQITLKKNEDWRSQMFIIYQSFEKLKTKLLYQSNQIYEQYDESHNINYMIRQLQTQREQINNQNVRLLANIYNDIKLDWIYQNKSFMYKIEDIFKDSSERFKIVIDIQDYLKYIEYQTKNLQQKQIAESCTSLMEVKQIGKPSKYIASFESAMNLNKKYYEQSQFIYFSNYCQIPPSQSNFYGLNFKFDNKTQNESIKGKISNNSVNEIMGQMQICHQCRCFYHKNVLQKCGYNNDNYQRPKSLKAYFDQYTQNIKIINLEKSKNKLKQQIIHSNKNKNNYYRYTAIGKRYQCKRYYCKLCLRSYNINDKTDLCPFCLGICFCSRCSRNDTIFKLKSLYLRLGGDIINLQVRSQFQKFISENQITSKQPSIILKEGLKQIINHQNNSKSQCDKKSQKLTRMIKVKQELDSLRILCYLLKKRQIIKHQIRCKKKNIILKLFEDSQIFIIQQC